MNTTIQPTWREMMADRDEARATRWDMETDSEKLEDMTAWEGQD